MYCQDALPEVSPEPIIKMIHCLLSRYIARIITRAYDLNDTLHTIRLQYQSYDKSLLLNQYIVYRHTVRGIIRAMIKMIHF